MSPAETGRTLSGRARPSRGRCAPPCPMSVPSPVWLPCEKHSTETDEESLDVENLSSTTSAGCSRSTSTAARHVDRMCPGHAAETMRLDFAGFLPKFRHWSLILRKKHQTSPHGGMFQKTPGQGFSQRSGRDHRRRSKAERGCSGGQLTQAGQLKVTWYLGGGF